MFQSLQGQGLIIITLFDTMNLSDTAAWAEEYAQIDTAVSVEVSGGGSGTGIAALIGEFGRCLDLQQQLQMANALMTV